MCGNSLHGTREIPEVSSKDGKEDRFGKAKGRNSNVYAPGKSDEGIVPKKRSNKERPISAENVEGRPSTKGNVFQTAACRTQSRGQASTGLFGVRKAARKDRKARFTALLHHVTPDLLRASFFALKRKAAPGIDGMTWEEYQVDLERRLGDLHERVHKGSYRAQPSRRTYIPKADGKLRPLGIAALEDKIVQQAVSIVLQQIYEEDFLGFSYGFRPRKSAHDALDALWMGIMGKKVNWVLDADIHGFFDAIDHEWMLRFLEHRIADRRILRLIRKWLRSGVREKGRRSIAKVGTPQGSVISPLLANVYLHYVLDLWVNSWRKTKAKGDVVVVRYADDFVLGFQYRHEAERFLRNLKERLKKFGLALHPDKTRLLEFGRFAARNRKERGLGKPETFDFLGFTHFCAKKRETKKFLVRRKSDSKRLRRKVKEVKATLMRRRHDPIPELGRWLAGVVRGYYNYYAIPGNISSLETFHTQVIRHWLKALRRRSQRHRMTWERFGRIADYWIPKPRILHPYPNVRFIAKHPR